MDCGVIHQELVGWDQTKLDDFYSLDYHSKFQKSKGLGEYGSSERYEHDVAVSNMRLNEYSNFLDHTSGGLDIGSSNAAFVYTARERGYDCWGLEPGEHLGDSSSTIRGLLTTAPLPAEFWDWVTMHDSIEHMTDLHEALRIVYTILRDNGRAIIDLPDFWDIRGKHHWKKIEHLWFLSEDQLTQIMSDSGFTVADVRRPIPGKLVFYCIKNKIRSSEMGSLPQDDHVAHSSGFQSTLSSQEQAPSRKATT